MKNKKTLETEKAKLVRKIVNRRNKLLLNSYWDIKRILEINKEIRNTEGVTGIANKVGYSSRWVYFLLALDNLKDFNWTKKIEVNTILTVLNWDKKAVEKQEEIFNKIIGKDIEEVKRLLYKNYTPEPVYEETEEKEVEVVKKKPPLIFLKVKRDICRAIDTTDLCRNFGGFTSKDRKYLRGKYLELNKKVKKVLNGSLSEKK